MINARGCIGSVRVCLDSKELADGTTVVAVTPRLATIAPRLGGERGGLDVTVEIDLSDVGATEVYLHGYGTGSGGRCVEVSTLTESAATSGAGHQMVALVGGEGVLTVEVHDHRDFATTLKVWRGSAGLKVQVSFDVAGPNSVLAVPTVFVRTAATLNEALSEFAADTATEMKARRPERPMRVWCSWYYNYQNFCETTLLEYLDGFLRLPADQRPEVVQIDAGNCTSLGDWMSPNHLWVSGLEAAAALIRRKGFRAGIWIGPFMVGNRSEVFRRHPDWMLHDSTGKRVVEMSMYGEQRLWGRIDEEIYILDSSHPEAFEYMRGVFAALRGMGFDYFKTDFMYWGYRSSRGVRRGVGGKTGTQYFRDFLAMVRREIGSESTWLACIAPFAPFIGYADAMRVGGDVVPDWGEKSPNSDLVRLLPNIAFANGVWWLNDPDAVLLRDFHTSLSPAEAKAISFWQGLHAGILNTSDPIHEMGAERRAWWEEMCRFGPRPAVPFRLNTPGLLGVQRRISADGVAPVDVLAILNPSATETRTATVQWPGDELKVVTAGPNSLGILRSDGL